MDNSSQQAVIQQRLTALRSRMYDAGIDAIVIPQTDPHQSEYLADHWQVREYFSGFTGSAGQLVVTATETLLWTDSRYFIQAAQQLGGTGIILMKEGLPGTPSIEEWLSVNLKPGSTVGIDGMVYSQTGASALKNTLSKTNIGVRTDFNPADAWDNRPSLPLCPVFIHDVKYAGRTAANKIATLLADSRTKGCDAIFISALDEIAWILNLRSSDVENNPVATAFLYLSDAGTTLLIDKRKISDEVYVYLTGQGISIAPYDSVKEFLASLGDVRVLVEPARNAATVIDLLGQRAIIGTPATGILKACKNAVQISGIRNAMARDGVALVRAFMEIEKRIAEGMPLTELDVCDILHARRSEQPLFFDESFGTIAGYGPHGAIVHYESTPETNASIVAGNLLLIDSGAQYLDGTTDITRTISIGTPTAMQRHDFTLVMKGHIALGRAIFPAGTTGHQLDALARQFLWREGLTYLHGTGHGVGHFLNVHEGPQSIRLNHVPTPLMPGMVTSNEPGLYRENIHGIRCENLVLTVPAMETEFGQFLRFETLTLFPFDLSLFETEIMTDDEIQWLNDYHATVRATLLPLLADDTERAWLTAKTEPLTR